MPNVDVISTIFQRELNRKLSDRPKLPFSQIADFRYKWVLQHAWDTIKVNVAPKIVMVDESDKNGWDLRKTTLEDIDFSPRNIWPEELKVNKLHRYAEEFSKLEEIQTTYNIGSERMNDLVAAINTSVEKWIIQVVDATILANASTNKLTANAKITKDNVAEEVIRLRNALSKKEVPMEGRFLLVSPDISGIIALAQILNGTDAGANAAIRWWLGTFAGFTVLESNLIESGRLYAIHKGAVNYVRQSITAKITEKEKAIWYNLLWEVAHGGKLFDFNLERVFVMDDAV